MPQPGAEPVVAVVRESDIEAITDIIDTRLQERGIFGLSRETCRVLACDVLQAVFDIDQIVAAGEREIAALRKQ